jgi:hypothetical protein
MTIIIGVIASVVAYLVGRGHGWTEGYQLGVKDGRESPIV